MSAARYRSIVDVHLLLLREEQVLLTRRANTGYADGMLHLVSGHLEAGEDVVEGVIREAGEEVGIWLDRDDVRCVHVMHHRNPEEEGRIGFFFQATSWRGEPTNREPHKCSEVSWWPLTALPDDIVPYPAAALHQIRAGHAFSLHGWPRAGVDVRKPGPPAR